MLEQIKKVVANGNRSGVVNSKIAVFKKKAVIENITFNVDVESRRQPPANLWYGIQWNIPQSGDTNIAVTRIGNMDLHQLLPLQKKMRRCLLSDSGQVLNYLSATDSTKLTSGATADLTGASGMVEVELPDTYYKFEEDDTYARCMISPYPLAGFKLWKKKYISAYEASVSRTTLTLASVVNNTAEYRGGNNTASWDETYRSLLGRPVTTLSMVEFMNYARKRGAGWYANTYEAHVQMFWLFAVEFCTFNSQAALGGASKSYVQQADGSKYAITNAQGLMEGGLGDGVSMFAQWGSFNSSNPFVPCGITNVLGNRTGEVPYTIIDENGDTVSTVEVPSYRGIENPFGHIWKLTEGAKVVTVSDANKLYVAEDLTSQSLADGNTNVSGYRFAGDLPATDGWVKNILGGEYGDILPKEIGGSEASFFYDYFSRGWDPAIPCAVGGFAIYGTSCGLGFVEACRFPPSTRNRTYGSRLCFQATALGTDDAEDKAALFNILPLYWLIEHPENGIYRVGNCPETTINAQGTVVIEGTKEETLSVEDCYLVIANWPDNMAITTGGIERVI